MTTANATPSQPPPTHVGGGEEPTKTYKPSLPANWWLKKSNYFWYMVREFTALPISLWLIWFLVEIQKVKLGPHGYFPHMSPAFIVFSVIVLLFALYHAITFISLSGVIIRVPMGEKSVPPALITSSMFGLWFVLTIIVGALIVWLGR